MSMKDDDTEKRLKRLEEGLGILVEDMIALTAYLGGVEQVARHAGDELSKTLLKLCRIMDGTWEED